LPPPGPGEVARPYLICATQRSGSGLLCRALAATGLAGIPTEYFDAGNRATLSARWGCGPSLPAYARALMARRASRGVFGAKLHWEQFQQVRAELLGEAPGDPGFEIDSDVIEALFPGVIHVHILRLDIDRQALSLWIAAQRGLFSLPRDREAAALPPVRYSFAGIERCRRSIVLGELHWDRFFRSNGIVPIEIVYEDLVGDHAGTLASLVGQLVPGADVPQTAPESRRLSDARSEAMLHRFRSDLRERRADEPLGVHRRGWRLLQGAARKLKGGAS